MMIYDQKWWEKFVAVWQASESISEVSKKMGITTDLRVSLKASQARQQGVPLKKFRGPDVDWKSLAASTATKKRKQ